MPETTFLQQYFAEQNIAQKERHHFLELLKEFAPLKTWLSRHHFPQQIKLDLLIEALTHSSFSHENTWPSYERLEFLGDALLQTVVSSEIYRRYPDKNEGELSKLRGALVNRDALVELAQKLDLGAWILLGQGEQNEAGASKPSVLADAFEAVLAAVFLSSDLETTQDFLLKVTGNVDDYWELSRMLRFDSKSQLQEEVMALYRELPIYESREIAGTKLFEVTLRVRGKALVTLQGDSKKQLMKECAKQVLASQSYLNI